MIVQNTLFTKLAAGESLPLNVTGMASNAANGGKTTVRARVLADVDLEELFPQGEDTAVDDEVALGSRLTACTPPASAGGVSGFIDVSRLSRRRETCR